MFILINVTLNENIPSYFNKSMYQYLKNMYNIIQTKQGSKKICREQ